MFSHSSCKAFHSSSSFHGLVGRLCIDQDLQPFPHMLNRVEIGWLRWVWNALHEVACLETLGNLSTVNRCTVFHDQCRSCCIKSLYVKIPQRSCKYYINIIFTLAPLGRHPHKGASFLIGDAAPNHDTFPPTFECWHQALLSIMFSLPTPYCACPWLLPDLNQWFICPDNRLSILTSHDLSPTASSSCAVQQW